MFSELPLTGTDLPPRTLCLTFDDGPGVQTAQLADYLHSEEISATFFVIGKHVQANLPAIDALVEFGHTVGNHTYTHPGLANVIADGGDPAGELLAVEQILAWRIPARWRLFRPPYGNWTIDRSGTPRGHELADRLNAIPKLATYVGPVLWDISAEDYAFWERRASAADCCGAYLEAIERSDRGIILMHDSSENPAAQRTNRALETCALLVPQLKARGFRFVSITEAPRICKAINGA